MNFKYIKKKNSSASPLQIFKAKSKRRAKEGLTLQRFLLYKKFYKKMVLVLKIEKITISCYLKKSPCLGGSIG